MGLLLIFNRKVIPEEKYTKEAGHARVETGIIGFLDGEAFDVGMIKFPTKQTWTKFWGAIQRGALAVPDIEVKMQNVMPDGGLVEADDNPTEKDTNPQPAHKFIGKQP